MLTKSAFIQTLLCVLTPYRLSDYVYKSYFKFIEFN